MLRLAVPLVRVPVPSTLAPSLKMIAPLAGEGESCALSVSCAPTLMEGLDAARARLVAVFVTGGEVIVTVWALLVALLVLVSPA